MSDDPAPRVAIYREPSDADVAAVSAAARRVVDEIANTRAFLGPQEVNDLYVRAIWRAVAGRGRPT